MMPAGYVIDHPVMIQRFKEQRSLNRAFGGYGKPPYDEVERNGK